MNQPPSSSIVAICIPSGDMVHADFAVNLAAMCLDPGARTAVINNKGSLIPVGRNNCVAAAQKIGATHALFLDTDMVFPCDVLKRLLRADKDIIGALYAARRPPFQAIGVPWEGVRETGGLHRMKIMPTGCLMIKMRVFEKLPKPWFNTRVEGEQIMGEDVHFCERATMAGFEIWQDVALSREVGHIGEKIFRLADKA
jgi:GT2 family glycosyltransferase